MNEYLQRIFCYHYIQIQMYKRKDNDIFGTSSIGYSPRIENNNYIDPNAAFKKKTEDNYEKYASQVNQISRDITAKGKDTSKVNEKAEFDDNYHKSRKEADLQSSIFYPPQKAATKQQFYDDLQVKKPNQESNFGRKETLKRQINNLPYNTSQIKGNSSRLFDFDTKTKAKTETSIPMAPLIPYQMQWDQHDSVKYAHINDPNKTNSNKQDASLNSIKESKSTYFPVDKKQQFTKPQSKKNPQEKTLAKVKSDSKIPTAKQIKGKEPVEVRIIKGWNFKLMEGLSKQCKLSNIAILKFEVGEKDQATLVIKRSDRWENITDWLRKDAKLKIRVMNN